MANAFELWAITQEIASLRSLVGELADLVPVHQFIGGVHDPKVCLKCRAEKARKPE